MCAPALSSVRPVHVDGDGNSMFKCAIDSNGWPWVRLSFASGICGLCSYFVAARDNSLVSDLSDVGVERVKTGQKQRTGNTNKSNSYKTK